MGPWIMFPEPRGDIILFAYAVFSVALLYPNGSGWARATLLWLALSLVPLALIVAYRVSPFHPLAQFPGPLLNKMTQIRLAYIVYTGKRHLEIARLHDEYGIVVRTGPNTLSINSHDASKRIYAASNCMDKSNAYRPGRLFDGGLFFIREKNIHDQRRRIWANAFSPVNLHAASHTLSRRSRQLAAHLAELDDQPINLSSWIRRWSYDVMGDLTFGKSSRIELMSDGDKDGVISSGQNATVLFEVLLAKRKQAETPEVDICSHLLVGDSESAKKLSDEDLEHDALFAIQAGSDTSSGVLILLLYYILANRDVYQKLTQELNVHFAQANEDDERSLFELPYLGAVVQEGLRLGTPSPGLPRVVPSGGCVIDSTFIPGGTIVGVPAYAQQISGDNFWPEPLDFRPDRWMPGGLGPGSVLNKSAVMCFSSGSFGCLGKTLAIRELYIATAQLLRELEIDLSPSFNHNAFREGIRNMRSTLFQYPLTVVIRPRA
ncbi:cytochrome P450 [Mycena maculata]|uniref:Cytochrome P450 n=1 Tax=Mycena maculata TaxID=230809 RepID=A0AAD7IR83_9AGAR|nr:cytochrome P450 [Mycena maculata]